MMYYVAIDRIFVVIAPATAIMNVLNSPLVIFYAVFCLDANLVIPKTFYLNEPLPCNPYTVYKIRFFCENH